MFQRWLEVDLTKSGLIIGPRRSGKTTFLKRILPDFKYITLDDFDYLEWANKDPKGLIQHLGTRAIIDEIQRVPSLSIAVKYAIDNLNALFFLTGSSSIGLLDATADTLAGRINIYHFPTACWGEDIGAPIRHLFEKNATILDLNEADRLFPDTLKYGLFPEILNQKSPAQKEEILQNYKNTYFTRDVMQLSNLENIEGIYAIYQHLTRSIGSHIEVANFAQESALSFPTTKKYLNALSQTELTFKLYGYQYGPAKRYIKANKTYFSDNGIITSFNKSVSIGQLIENFVISELEKRRKLGFIKTDALFYYKSNAGREIDVIFEVGDQLYAIEIKSTEKPRPRDTSNLCEFAKQLKRKCRLILFYLGQEYQTINQVELVPIASLFKAGFLL